MHDVIRWSQSLRDEDGVTLPSRMRTPPTDFGAIWSGIGVRLRFASVIGLAMGFSYPILAAPLDSTATSATAVASMSVSCRDQLMLDRRDNPQRALTNFYHCNAVRNIRANMEHLTFWYVTLPAASKTKQDSAFEKAWKNNIRLLTNRTVNFTKESAIEVLDDSIIRGLKRGKREDLVEGWLAAHNPEVLAVANPAPEQNKKQPYGANIISVSASSPASTSSPSQPPVASGKAAVATEPAPTEKATTPPAEKATAQRPDRQVRRRHRRSAPPHPDDRYLESEGWRSAPLGATWYAPVAMAPVPYGPPPYYPPAAYYPPAYYPPAYYPPAQSAGQNTGTTAPAPSGPLGQQPYSPPPGQPVGQNTSAIAPAPSGSSGPQPYSPPPGQPVEQNAGTAADATFASYGRQLSPIEQQIDSNVRTISRLIGDNFRFWEQQVIKPTFFK